MHYAKDPGSTDRTLSGRRTCGSSCRIMETENRRNRRNRASFSRSHSSAWHETSFGGNCNGRRRISLVELTKRASLQKPEPLLGVFAYSPVDMLGHLVVDHDRATSVELMCMRGTMTRFVWRVVRMSIWRFVCAAAIARWLHQVDWMVSAEVCSSSYSTSFPATKTAAALRCHGSWS